jgi:hypothetical protein
MMAGGRGLTSMASSSDFISEVNVLRRRGGSTGDRETSGRFLRARCVEPSLAAESSDSSSNAGSSFAASANVISFSPTVGENGDPIDRDWISASFTSF